MTSFTTLFTALLVAASSVVAAPVQPVELIVFSPTITSPTQGAIWSANTTETVTWDTSNIPAEKQNSTGLLLLGYLENNSENLDIAHPLAANFPINAGTVNFTVPSTLPQRDDYIVVLFGDSGNKSPSFTINPSNQASLGSLL
ncbi:hypothetical protein NEOLEDRAFT_1069645 [Neolentinus lepideus HHB14362 ss-1]|uniref:Yeast cell wall synthesis Kre9/Knh1-like N-terminal domain-containing protein n=1 Tax=Neolentinus lepideus HHB14362 ss-1 TaxID=1314782 RepID=A0A165R976_9AGAM|nr:hypothetical protein NEOLEDRAFT_1069645 [Neolentinus lepideus HHB14362 ss-1]